MTANSQSEKAVSSMSVTEAESVIASRFMQLWKAFFPIDTRLSGPVKVLRDEHM